jgi:hypothetical protein
VVILFKERSPAIIIWVLLLTIGLHTHSFFEQPIVVTEHKDGLISYLLRDYLPPLPSVIIVGIYLLFLVSQALRLNYIMNELKMFQQSNSLTAMSYVMFASLMPAWHTLSAALIANTFIIWIYGKLLKLYNNHSPKTLLYNIGLITGIAIGCYHPLVLMIFAVVFTLLIIRPFHLTELIILLMGILTPFYFLGVFLFLADQWEVFIRYLPSRHFELPLLSKDWRLYLTAGLLGIGLIAGILVWQQNNRRMLIHTRKNWGVLFIILLCLLPIPFLHYKNSVNAVYLWLMPLSAFTANAFLYPKKRFFPLLLFWIIAAISVFNNWFYK